MKKDVVLDAVKKVNDKFEFNKKYLFIGAVAFIGLVAGCQFYGKDKQEMQMPAVNVTACVAEEKVVNNPKNYSTWFISCAPRVIEYLKNKRG